MITWSRRFFALLLSAALLLSMASCGSEKEEASSGEEENQEALLEENLSYRFTALFPQDDMAARLYRQGMEDAADMSGATVEFTYRYSKGSVSQEGDELSAIQKSNADAVLLAPVNEVDSIAALSRVQGRGVATALLNCSSKKADFALVRTQTSPYELGKAAGAQAKTYLQGQYPEGARILVLENRSEDPTGSSEKVRGFLDEVQGLSNLTIIRDYEAVNAAQAEEQIRAFFKDPTTPSAHAIFVTSATAAEGADRGIIGGGQYGKIVLFTTELEEEGVSLLTDEQNTIEAAAMPDYYSMGYDAVTELISALGNENPKPVTSTQGPILLSPHDPDGITDYLR